MSAFAIHGELSIYRAADLKAPLLAALEAEGELELDLSGVTEMDTAGLQLVLLARREAGACGKRMTLAACSEAVRDVLALCGIRIETAGEAA